MPINWPQYWKMKWDIFAYNYGWSKYVPLFDGWIAKCAMVIPVVGYLIIFNDTIAQHLSFNSLANESAQRFGLRSTERLKLIYYGLIFLGSANILYRIRRPFTFKVGTNRFDYVERALTHFTIETYIDLNGTIRHEGHYTKYGKYYDAEFDALLDLATGQVADERKGRDTSTINWGEAKDKFEGLLRAILIETFFRNDVKNRTALSLCLALALVGYGLLLIPSADLFIKVLLVTFPSGL